MWLCSTRHTIRQNVASSPWDDWAIAGSSVSLMFSYSQSWRCKKIRGCTMQRKIEMPFPLFSSPLSMPPPQLHHRAKCQVFDSRPPPHRMMPQRQDSKQNYACRTFAFESTFSRSNRVSFKKTSSFIIILIHHLQYRFLLRRLPLMLLQQLKLTSAHGCCWRCCFRIP